ncbi:hypothetical protein V6N11_044433 [Hibiscus sabdariffa]|uniref:Putative plant transposon protein domain-containing protein n=1 Tax=Hibiscus sabdariffa TaxID=183260 RepID=A0ABR2RFL3_9ROSI
MARCKNAPETSGRTAPTLQIRYFEDDDAKARHQAIKGRQILAERGFVFKGTSTEGFPPSVMATITMHKWEKFVTHPGEHIQFTVAKINKFYGLQMTVDNHSKFVSGLKGKSNDFLLEDLCIPGANWDSANTSVDRDRLKPEGKLWMHFIKQSLMPTSHTATASLSRLQLLHSILNGRSIDVGKIIVDEAYACLTRKSSPLLFPHLITALCRKKGVFESPEDLQKKGRLGITAENIPSLMGFDETTPAKQPLGGARTVAAAKLAALTTMAENTRDQLEGQRTDLQTYFNYVQERDQVIKANFNEMLPQSSLNFPTFPQDLLKPIETRMPEQQPAQPAAEHATNPPQDKPLETDSTSSSPTPPDVTPQHQSPPTQRRKGKETANAPTTPAVEVDSEETVALEEEEPQRTPTPPVATTPVRRRTKRTAQRVLVDDSEEEVQSGAGEEDEPTIIPPTHPTSIKRKATKRARRATTK